MTIEDIKQMIAVMRHMGFNELVIGLFVRQARYCMTLKDKEVYHVRYYH